MSETTVATSARLTIRRIETVPIRIPLAYPIAKRDQQLAAFVNTWIALKRKDGTIDDAYKHWILGQDATPRQPRWSIVRNVLHWVE